MNTIKKYTYVNLTDADYIAALDKCATVEERYNLIRNNSDCKMLSLRGFWKKESIIGFIKRTYPSFADKIIAAYIYIYIELNLSKYGQDYRHKPFKLTIGGA